MTSVDQARAAWYRERAATHGTFVRNWLTVPDLLHAGTADTVEAIVALAREAAHYALAAVAIDERHIAVFLRPQWCAQCESWRHTSPCGRDECAGPVALVEGLNDGTVTRKEPK